MAKWLIFASMLIILTGCSKSIELSYVKSPSVLTKSKKINVKTSGDDKKILSSLLGEMQRYNDKNSGYFEFGNDIQMTISTTIKNINNNFTEQSDLVFCSDYYRKGNQEICLQAKPSVKHCNTINIIETAVVNAIDLSSGESFSFTVDGSNSSTVCSQPYQNYVRHYILAPKDIRSGYYEFGAQKYVLVDSYQPFQNPLIEQHSSVQAPTGQLVAKIIKKLTPSIERYTVDIFEDPDTSWPRDKQEVFNVMIDAIDDGNYEKANVLLLQLEQTAVKKSFPILYNKAVLAEAEGKLSLALSGYEEAGKATFEMKKILMCVDSVTRVKMLQKNKIQEGKAGN